MTGKHYFVSGVVHTGNPAYFAIMEESEGKQVNIAQVIFNNHINPKYGREPAMRDARLIVAALNAYEGQ